eukprot:3702091-Amphidinium_carterae.1
MCIRDRSIGKGKGSETAWSTGTTMSREGKGNRRTPVVRRHGVRRRAVEESRSSWQKPKDDRMQRQEQTVEAIIERRKQEAAAKREKSLGEGGAQQLGGKGSTGRKCFLVLVRPTRRVGGKGQVAL